MVHTCCLLPLQNHIRCMNWLAFLFCFDELKCLFILSAKTAWNLTLDQCTAFDKLITSRYMEDSSEEIEET